MNRQHSQSGFTITEMMIVISIIAIMSTIIVMRLAGSTDPIELSNATAIIRTDMNTTMTWAQTGRIEETTGRVPKGYGMRFIAGTPQYTLYAAFDDDHQYTQANDVIVRSIDLLQDEYVHNITLKNCSPAAFDAGHNTCDVFVEQPSGRVWFNGERIEASMNVVIEQTKNHDTATIQWDRASGKIEEQ